MALVLKDRVQETATANTTVSFTCTGAIAGFQAFSVIGNANTTFYTGVDGSGNWESGIGTYTTAGTLVTRTTILASSNAGSAVTFSGPVNLFVDYPATKSINLDASGNVSPLGTVASGTWHGTTVGVGYGGTGVTASSGANSVVLRDTNQNITANNIFAGFTSTVSSAVTLVLTVASTQYQRITGTLAQTIKLPDATTLSNGFIFYIDGDSSVATTVIDNALATLDTIAPGGVTQWVLLSNATTAGTWVAYGLTPSAVDWGTNTLDLATTVVSNGTWNGGTIASGYGGTGLTTFAAANNALYSTSAGALAAGTLPVLAGGTGVTTSTGTGSVVLSASPTFTGTTTAANLAYTGTLTGGTGVVAIGTNQIYKDASGNVGIGTSSPSAKLSVVGSLAVNANYAAWNGAVTAVQASTCAIWTNSNTTGFTANMYYDSTYTRRAIYSNYCGELICSNGGVGGWDFNVSGSTTAGSVPAMTTAMTIDSSGNVGIGTTGTPANKLVIAGGVGEWRFSPSDITVGSNSEGYGTTFSGGLPSTIVSAAGGGKIFLGGNGRGDSLVSAVAFYSGNTESMRIDSSGNVGIGTSSPVTSLTVQAGSGNGIKVYDASAGVGGTSPTIESIGSRGDGNGSFGGRFGAGFRRNDGTAIGAAVTLGQYAFGGQWGTGTTYNQTNFLYAASVVGVSEGSFTSATAMPTALVFNTGSTGSSLQSINVAYGTERLRITSAGGVSFGSSGTAYGTSGQLLKSNGNAAPTWITAIPVANGGTNATTASITSFNNITGYTAAGATGTTSTNIVFSTSPTLVTPVLGVATGTSLAVTGAITSSGAGIGYATGAGGLVTQLTGRTTGVTLSKLTGRITLFTTTLAAVTSQAFVLTNTFIAATDAVIVYHVSGGTLGLYNFAVTPAAGSATITIRNNSAAVSASEAPVLQFVVIKAVTA
jgi:hypothetical protein